MRPTWAALGLGLIASATSCDEGTATAGRGPLYTTRDSAGIVVLDYRTPDSTEIERWEIDAKPTLVIGSEGRGPGHDLTWSNGLTRMWDGRIIVALGRQNEARVFDSTGEFVGRIGRRGRGPGEFNDLEHLSRIRGDTLVAYNRYPEHVLFFAPDGRFVRSSRVVKPGTEPEHAEFPAFQFADFFDDGSLLVARHPGEKPVPPGGVLVDSIHPLRIDASGRVLADYGKRWERDQVRVEFPPRSFPGGRPFNSLPFFRREAAWGRAGGQLFYTTRDRLEIELWTGDGRLARIIRVPTRTILKSDADSHRVRFGDLDIDLSAGLPDTLQPVTSVIADRAGNLWVTMRERASDGIGGAIVFDSTGVLRARAVWRVDSTATGRALRYFLGASSEIGDDYVLVSAVDSMDVQHVVLRPLLKPRR
jgi:hypothetical protein